MGLLWAGALGAGDPRVAVLVPGPQSPLHGPHALALAMVATAGLAGMAPQPVGAGQPSHDSVWMLPGLCIEKRCC